MRLHGFAVILLVTACRICSGGEPADAEREFRKLAGELAGFLKAADQEPAEARKLLVRLDLFATVHPASPHAPEALYRRAMLGSELLPRPERIKALQRLVKVYPASPLCEAGYFSLGEIYLDNGKPGPARDALCQLLLRYPRSRLRVTAGSMLKQIDLLGTRPQTHEARDIDGSLVKVPQDGSPTVIGFWASWSDSSVRQQQFIATLPGRFKSSRLRVVSICIDGEAQRARRVPRPKGTAQTHVLNIKGWDCALAREFRVIGVPSTFILDRSGVVRYIGAGSDGVTKAIEDMLQPAKEPHSSPRKP